MAATPELNNAYRQQRQRLLAALTAAAVAVFGQEQGNQPQGVSRILALVAAGQQQMVNLVNGYLALATGATPQQLDALRYTVAALRNANPAEVYSQPYAALTVALMAGESKEAALASGVARLSKLVSTDLQLAQTHSARDWMNMPDSGVTGWIRVPDATACALCQAAAGQVYHTSDLMPIHEHCGCGVEPITDSSPKFSRIDASVRVVPGDIGPRLMADNWGEG
jgi:hypothetical protein